MVFASLTKLWIINVPTKITYFYFSISRVNNIYCYCSHRYINYLPHQAPANDRKGIFYQLSCQKKLPCSRCGKGFLIPGLWLVVAGFEGLWLASEPPLRGPCRVTRNCPPWLVQFQWHWPNGGWGDYFICFLPLFHQRQFTLFTAPTWQFQENVTASYRFFDISLVFCKTW